MSYIWDHSTKVYSGTENSDSALTLGMTFQTVESVEITHISFWKTSNDTDTARTIGIYNDAGTLIGTGSSSGEPTGTAQWLDIALDTPLTTTASAWYTAAVFHPGAYYPATSSYFNVGYFSADGKVYAASSEEASAATAVDGSGSFHYGGSIGYPDGTFNAADYWIDVKYSTSGGGVVEGAGSAAGSAIAAASGKAIKSAVGSVDGVGSAAATGRPRAATTGSAAGSSQASAVGAKRVAVAASAAGHSTAQATGFTSGIVSAVGTAAGTSTAHGTFVLQSVAERTLSVSGEQRGLLVPSEDRTLQLIGE
jgi:hypothetical protein